MNLINARVIEAEDTVIDGKVVSTEYAPHRSYFINSPLGLAIIDDDAIFVLKNQEAFRDPPLCVDLMCGAGGASLGMQRAGFKTVGIELMKAAAETYQLNLDNCIRADVCHLPLRPYLEPDVVWASAPCQDFTSINTRRNQDKFRNSPRAYLIVVAAIQIRVLHPKAVIMENVPQAAKSWQWKWATEILKEGGYEVRTDFLDAVNYGVPQYRYRAFMFASRVGPLGLPPRPTHGTMKEIMKGLDEKQNTGAKRSAKSFIEIENQWLEQEARQLDDSPLDRLVKELYVELGIIDRDFDGPNTIKDSLIEGDYELVNKR